MHCRQIEKTSLKIGSNIPFNPRHQKTFHTGLDLYVSNAKRIWNCYDIFRTENLPPKPLKNCFMYDLPCADTNSTTWPPIRETPAFPATAVVGFKAKRFNLYSLSVHPPWTFGFLKRLLGAAVNSHMRVILRKLALRSGQVPINPRTQKKF